MEKGVVTGRRRKSLHKGKVVVNFLMGSRAFYDWANDNPVIEMRTVDYTNDPYVMARRKEDDRHKLGLGDRPAGSGVRRHARAKQFSGVGGQLDFVRGARMSEGGKAIIALPSAAKGDISRIVPVLKEGAAVTTSRNDVDYVVTDYGIAALRGKTVQARMKALINVAHPAFREDLRRKARDIYHVSL